MYTSKNVGLIWSCPKESHESALVKKLFLDISNSKMLLKCFYSSSVVNGRMNQEHNASSVAAAMP